MDDLDRQLRALVDAGPTIGSDEARGRAASPRRRAPARRRIAIAVALLAVVGIIAAGALVVGSGGDAERNVIVPVEPSSAPSPSEIVVVTEDGRLVVLDADGSLLRTLSDEAAAAGQLSVAPDGDIYFLQNFLQKLQNPTIAEVPAGGGSARNVIGEGCCIWWPAVSPDGRWLAYSGVPNQSDAGRDVLLQSRTVTDPATYDRRWASATPQNLGPLEVLGWTPDSSAVVYRLYDGPDANPTRVLDIATAPSANLLDQPVLPLPDDLSFEGYVGRSDTMLLVDRSIQPNVVLTWDPATDRRVELFALPHVRRVSTDTTGDHLLVVADAGLHRWSTGDDTPTRIADAVAAAAWLPSAPRTPVDDATTDAPSTTITTGTTYTTGANGHPSIQVLNGSGIQGDATMRTNDLRSAGWRTLPVTNAPELRTGTVVECLDGFAAATAALVADLRRFGIDASVARLPDPRPPGYDAAAVCVVVLGSRVPVSPGATSTTATG